MIIVIYSEFISILMQTYHEIIESLFYSNLI